ncbi:MAG: hypothetical protein ACK4YM_02320 [Novosphingobium sp.]
MATAPALADKHECRVLNQNSAICASSWSAKAASSIAPAAAGNTVFCYWHEATERGIGEMEGLEQGWLNQHRVKQAKMPTLNEGNPPLAL